MRRRATLLALALPLMAAGAGAGNDTPAPRIRVEPESFDFGKVKAGSHLRKVFRLRNLGEGDLVIERISRSCQCTLAEADSMSLPPGASTPLRVGVEMPDEVGAVQHQVLVRSNDPETPSLEIVLRATVVAR